MTASTSAKQVLVARLDRFLGPFKMLQHRGLQALVRDGMPIQVAQQLARSYGPVNAASPMIMTAGLTRIRERDLFYVLLRNLWEECGEGDVQQSHVEMFELFARAVGVTPSRELVEGSRGKRLVDDFLVVCRTEPEHCVLGMFHGFEAVFPHICSEVDKALSVSKLLETSGDGLFFPFHAVHDLDHARTTRDAMLRAATTEAQLQDCLDFAVRGATRVFEIFDEVFAQDS